MATVASLSWKTRLRQSVFGACPRSWWPWVPGSSASFGPPRRSICWEDYARLYGDRWVEAVPGHVETIAHGWTPLPVDCPELSVGQVAFPAAGVGMVRRGRLLHRAGFPVGRGDRYLGEFMDRGLEDDSAAFSVPLRARRLPAWPGRTLHLSNVWASQNFYHWLIDAIGKALVFQRAGFKWSDVDRILLPSFDTPATRRVLQALGIPEGMRVSLGPNEQVACEELWLPSMPAPQRFAPAWLTSWLRDLFPAKEVPRGRRVFLDRRGGRAPANAEELGALLKSHGFETLDALDFDALLPALAGADCVVGIHGAGLTNVVWGRTGARFLEIIPDSHAWPFYRALAVGAGVDYGALVISRRPDGRGPLDWENNEPFTVPLDELARLLAKMIHERG